MYLEASAILWIPSLSEGMQGGKAKGRYVVLDLTVTDLHQVCTENCNSQIRHHACPALSRAKYYAERHAPQWIHNNSSVSARASHGAPVAHSATAVGLAGSPAKGQSGCQKNRDTKNSARGLCTNSSL